MKKRAITSWMMMLFWLSLLPFNAQSAVAGSADAEGFRFQVHTSLWTTHFNPKPEHNNTQNLLAFERYNASFSPEYLEAFQDYMGYARSFAGAAWFRNSFGQKSVYLYGGIRQELHVHSFSQHEFSTYAKLTAGLIHGYRGEFRNKIPFNQTGIAPAIIPMVGAQYRSGVAELTLFGASGLMLMVGMTF